MSSNTRKHENPYPKPTRRRLVPLAEAVIQADQPLLYPVYRYDGTLLAEKGLILTANQANTLREEAVFTIDRELESGIYGDKQSRAERVAQEYRLPSPFERLRQIEAIVSDVYSHPEHPANKSKLLTAVGRIQSVCLQAPDAALAKIFLDNIEHYAIHHSVHTAVLCELVANYLHWDPEHIRALTAAALTMNISMGTLQNNLHRQSEPLSVEQQQIVQNHPLNSAKMLRNMEIRDKKWLEYVEKHHESLDGSGYPAKLAGDDIPLGASLLQLADIYCAKITGRSYRKPIFPNIAARDIYLTRDDNAQGTLIEIFVKVVGLYPPGAMVRLANKEVAVVVRRGSRVDAPFVRSIAGPQGAEIRSPVLRSTDQKNYSIKEIIGVDPQRTDLNYEQFWS